MTTVKFDSPFIHTNGNTAYSITGDVIKCYKLDLIESYSFGENNFDALFSVWYKAFKSLGVTVVKQDVCLKKYYDTSNFKDKTFLQRNDKNYFHGKEYIEHNCYIFFIYSNKKSILKNDNISNPFKFLPSPDKIKEESYQINEVFNRDIEQTISYINASGMIEASPINALEIEDFSRAYFNGFYSDRNTDTKKTKTHYQIGNKLVGSYVIKSLKDLPERISNCVVDSSMSTTDFKFYRGFGDILNLGLKFDHVYTQILYLENHKDIKADIVKNKEILFGARALNSDNDVASKQITSYLNEVSEDENIKFIRAHFNVSFFADSENEYKICDNEISKTFKEMDIKPYYPVGNNLANIYNNSFFAFATNLDVENTFIIDLQQAICFLNTSTNYKNDDEGVYFSDRIYNLPLKKDIWDRHKKRIKARNFFVMAPTGGGKSVTMAQIMRQYYEDDVIIVINDLGDSYQKLTCLIPPEEVLYIKYKEGQPLGINPLHKDGEVLKATQVNQILGFTTLLWKRNDSIKIEEEVSLRKIIQCFYETVPTGHSFPTFYEFISINKVDLMTELEIEYNHFAIDEFLHNCSEFVGNGTYAFLFKNNEDFTYDISKVRVAVFEFDEAKEDPLLLSVILLISSEITRRLCWLDKDTRGVVLFDEFAKFLKFANILNSVQYYFQAARKQECAIGIVLQTPAQLPINDTANSIIENTQIVYVLENDKGYDPIIDRFKMGTHAQNQMKSIKSNFNGKEKYSELYLQIGAEGNVVRIHVPADNLLAYMTEGAENNKIMAIYDEVKDMEKAIEIYKSNLN